MKTIFGQILKRTTGTAPGAGPGTGRLLTGIIIVLVLAGVGGISIVAINLLTDQADQRGRARVEIGVITAREDVRQMSEDMLTSARILAGRPTLLRLLTQRRRNSIGPFLQRICETGGLDACAVVEPGHAPLAVGEAVDWEAVLDASQEQGESFLVAFEAGETPVFGARATIGSGQAEVLAVRIMDETLAADLSQRADIDIRILDYPGYAVGPTDDFRSLHSRALAGTSAVAAKIRSRDLYAASIPVATVTGEVVALLEARLPTSALAPVVERLIKRLVVISIVIGLLALIAGLLMGRRISAPLQALTRAAEQIAEGDFSTSIPLGGAAEVDSLARTMENMRHSLVELTGTLRRREAEAQAVLGGIVEGVYAVDRDRRIRYLNPQAERLLGMPAAEVIGRFCGDVLRPKPDADGRRPCEYDCPIVKARAGGDGQATEQLAPTGGVLRTTVITSAPLIDNLQVQVIRDETDLEGVRRARDSVLANISHEFRTPLAAQLASIELLREGLDTLEAGARRELVLSLERGTLRLTRLIDNLLESVRIESGQLALRRYPVGVAELVASARELIGSLLAQRNQPLEAELPADLPQVHGDGTRLTQVMVNLLANASKFAPEGSVIRIGAEASGGRVTVWVEDEGPGVPQPSAGSIFDRFYRGPESEPEPGGLGLGLWIVKSIVERHGGAITAGSTPEGRTRFNVTLPAESAE